MKRLLLFILVALLLVPTFGARAQGVDPTPAQVYTWGQVFLSLLGVVGVAIGMYAIGRMTSYEKGLQMAREAIQSARNDVVGMNKIEAGLVEGLKPAGIDALNAGENALFNLFMMAFASKFDAESLSTIKAAQDYFNSITDRKPNVPPEQPATLAKG